MDARRFLADLTAGLTVSFAAISLGAAFGVMSGRGAFAGMIAAAIIPIITSIFGGTRVQASGPTAPMTAISALCVAFAYDTFSGALAEQFITLIFLLNALFLIVAGLLGLGKLISLIPNVVILGFMNGIGLLIWKDQIAKVFAFNNNPIMKGGAALNFGLAAITFGLIFGIVWMVKKFQLRQILRSLISGVLVSLLLMTGFSIATGLMVENVQLGNSVGSVQEFTTMLINYFPTWEILQPKYILLALPYALQLTLLAYLDSLLTALVVDKLNGERSKLNKELVAQGLGNAVSGILQGIPGAQATIRSVLLIKEGAQTRMAGILVGVFALLSIALFGAYLSLVPAAVFVGVLLKAGLDVCNKDFLKYYFQRGWHTSLKRNTQLLFIAYTTIITVMVDLNIAVITGTILFYIGKYFWNVSDSEADFEQVSEQEPKLIAG